MKMLKFALILIAAVMPLLAQHSSDDSPVSLQTTESPEHVFARLRAEAADTETNLMLVLNQSLEALVVCYVPRYAKSTGQQCHLDKAAIKSRVKQYCGGARGAIGRMLQALSDESGPPMECPEILVTELERRTNELRPKLEALKLLQTRLTYVDSCAETFQSTINEKFSDQTRREIEQINACKSLGMYPPPR
jgi:hypothetical protein